VTRTLDAAIAKRDAALLGSVPSATRIRPRGRAQGVPALSREPQPS